MHTTAEHLLTAPAPPPPPADNTSPIHGPPCQHPPCKASTSVVTSGALPPVL